LSFDDAEPRPDPDHLHDRGPERSRGGAWRRGPGHSDPVDQHLAGGQGRRLQADRHGQGVSRDPWPDHPLDHRPADRADHCRVGAVRARALFVELLGRSDGIGYRIEFYYQMFNMGAVLAHALLFLFIMLFLEVVVLGLLERRLFRWRPAQRNL
jgi:hypothetical protein